MEYKAPEQDAKFLLNDVFQVQDIWADIPEFGDFSDDLVEFELRKLTADCDPLEECGGSMYESEELDEIAPVVATAARAAGAAFGAKAADKVMGEEELEEEDLDEATKLQDEVSGNPLDSEGKLTGTGKNSKTGKTGKESLFTKAPSKADHGGICRSSLFNLTQKNGGLKCCP